MRRPNDGVITTDKHGVLPEIDYDLLEFFERLSSGTYGTVYRAKWNPSGLIVAVKRLLVLEKEAHILSLLRHRNIIQFFGAVTKPPNFCIVTEYASHGSLYSYLHDKDHQDLAFDSIVQWALDIASGIHYLHFEAPVAIVHRDLKSKNVVISSYDVCKLCDFGTSKALAHSTRMLSAWPGTMPWMSPEMIKSMPVNEATDTWSYGVILWELITREIPFEKINEFQIAWMVAENGVRLKIPTSCPEVFTDLLNRCWETDPNSRLNFKEILNILNEIQHDDSTSIQTREFLGKKSEWKLEILKETERLKEIETELTVKQTKLREWEQRLQKREQTFEYNRRRQLPSYDVNVWTEEDVVTWLLKLTFTNVTYQQSTELAGICRSQQITGERLLLLTETDLTNMGVNSKSFQWQLLREITRLNYDNRRLINFPPLLVQNENQTTSSSKDEKIRRGSSTPAVAATQPKSVDLTLLFCIFIRSGTSMDLHKWKLLMDIDDDNDFLITHPTIDEFEQLITDVRFMISTPPYTMYKVNRSPYVMREWLIGLDGTTKIQCVVNFTDNVRQPRNTTFSFDVDYERRGLLMEKRVQLYLKTSLLTPRSVGGSASASSAISSVAGGLGQSRNYLSPNTVNVNIIHASQSTPVLAPAWQDRSFPDAVPVVLPLPATPQKSPLWSQIVSGLMQDPATTKSASQSKQAKSRKKTISVPTPTVDLDEQQYLNTRAISHDPRHVRLQSKGGGSSRSSIGSDMNGSTIPRQTQQSISYVGGESEKIVGVERAQSVNLPTPVIPRRTGGRRKYPRNVSFNQRTSDSLSTSGTVTESSSDSSSQPNRQLNEILENLNVEIIGNEHPNGENSVGRVVQAPESSSSVMSVQVHGGYQKWKWKQK